MTRRPARLARLATLALLAGCAPVMKSPTQQASERSAVDWGATLAQVDVELAANRYAIADRLLLDFQQTHPQAPELPEAALRRALFMLDPSNTTASPADARVVLDSLLAGAVDARYRSQAAALRRLATALETRPVVVRTVPGASPAAAAAAAASPKAEDTKAKDDEIARLKEELSRANAELERIRRRIATPKP